MDHEEIQALRTELDEYRKEKEQIKQLIGQIGGTDSSWTDKLLNYAFIGLIVIIFILDILRHFEFDVPLSSMLSLEIGVLLVSVKIIWMMHRQARVEHFQFWILNSIEFRLNAMAKSMRKLEKGVNNSPNND